MKFAVSNIAWAPGQRLDAYALLRDFGFSGLEIAPALFFAGEADPTNPSPEAMRSRRNELDRFGLELVSMQSLLYGVSGAALFGAPEAVDKFASGLRRAIELAGRLGIGNLVVGSPRQRVVPPEMTREAILARTREVLLPLGDLTAARGAHLALEPNATAYGTNFMTTVEETLDIIRALDHPAVMLNFDTGALYMTDSFSRLAALAAAAAPSIAHVHVSSANLAPAPATEADGRAILDGMAASGYSRAVSIEMAVVHGDTALAALRAAIIRLRAAAAAGGYL